VSVDAVHFDTTGSPFFTEFASAQLRTVHPTPAELDSDEAFRDERHQLSVVAGRVLSIVRVDPEVAPTLSALIDWLSDEANTDERHWDQMVERRLFDLGAPEPLRLTADVIDRGEDVSRVVRSTGTSVPIDAGPVDAAPASSEMRSVLALPLWLEVQLAEAVKYTKQQISSSRAAVAEWLRPVRARTWVFATIGVLCMIVVATVIAIDAADNEEQNAQANQLSESAEASAPEEILPVDSPDPLTGDPQQALAVLLEARQRCLRDLSIGCLESVSPPGTPAYARDTALIEAVLAGAELPVASLFDSAVSVESQQLGDSILFEFVSDHMRKPASVLLVKGEAGWRIRSYTLPE
jgi:hypothetical protein